MISLTLGRSPAARTIHIHPAWLLGPLGLLGCMAIGLAQGWFQSLLVPVVLLGGLAAAAWLGAVLIRPEWALLFYAFAAVNLNGVDLPVPLGGLRLSPDIILTSLLILGVLLRLLMERKSPGGLPITIPYFVFLAVPVITLLWSPVPFQSLKGMLRFVGYYALMWLIVDVVSTPQQAKRLLTAILLSPIIPITVGLYQLVTGGGQQIWAGEQFNRVYGLAGGPFTLAFYLVLMIPLQLVFFLGRPSTDPAQTGRRPLIQNRWFLGLLLCGSLATLVLTFIRGSWLSLALAIMLLGIVRFHKLLIAFPAAVAALLWAYAPAQSRLAQTLDPNSTLFGRLRLWQFAWEWVTTSPLLGVGMKAFEYYYVLLAGPQSDLGLDRRERFLVGQRPHNELLGYLLDVGIVGTVALGIVVFQVLRSAVRVYRRAQDETLRLYGLAFLISAAGMLVGAAGDNVFSQPTVAVYFWIMAGLILALDRRLAAAGQSA